MIYTAEQFTTGLREFGDPIYPNFGSWPEGFFEAANKWTDLMDSTTKDIYPIVIPSIRITAKNTLAAQLDTAFSSGAGIHSIPAALQIYAATLATGMQPLFTAVPPVIPLNLVPILALAGRNPTALESMQVMGRLVTIWLKTGSAVNNASGAVISWL